MKTRRALASLLLLAIPPGSPYAQDVVRTKSGERIEGDIAAETSAGVVVRTKDGLTRFVASEAVAAIEREEVGPLVREEFAMMRTMDGEPDAARLFERVFDKPMPRIEEAWKRYVLTLR